MAETEIKSINGYTLCDNQARSDIEELNNELENMVVEETDPTVPTWAKQPNKPTYTANEVGALPNTTKIPAKTSDLTNDSGFITGIPSEYVTESELTAKKYLTSVPSEYITETELNAKGYLTQHQDLSSYAKKTDIPSVPTKTSQLTNDSGYLTAVPSEYVTETELTAKKYLTSVPSEYVTDSELTAKGYAKQTEVDSLSEEIEDMLPKNQGAENVGKILVVGTDGNLTLTDMPEGGVSGDVVGVLDESNNILLSGNLANGTYTLKYEVVGDNGEISYTEIGTLEVGAIVTYTITQNLTKVTSDNSVTEVRKGESITVNLTANSGYNLKSITVTMGGADITSTAVSGGKVTIASVTGDVVITAVAEEIKVIEPVTENIALTNGIRIGSDGGDRTLAGYCATPHIDLSNIPKPCIINLTKAKWTYATASETGTIMYYATKADGTKLVGGYTNDTIGSGYFNVVRNNGKNTDVTVTVTSNEVAKIRFAGNWSNSDVRDDYGFADWDTNMHAEATLTYTPEA